MTLTEFLLARFDEAEAEIPPLGDDPFLPHGQHWSEVPYRNASARFVLADLKAKRRIAEAYNKAEAEWTRNMSDEDYYFQSGLEVSIRLLAEPYADHEDFDPRWASAIALA
jgi:uncharacterized protein DUF6221